jgi:hypothetical protein
MLTRDRIVRAALVIGRGLVWPLPRTAPAESSW